MKRFLPAMCAVMLSALSALPVVPVQAAPQNVRWSARLEPGARAGAGAQVVVTAIIAKPWHLYSLTQPKGGAMATKIRLLPNPILRVAGAVVQPKPRRQRNAAGRVDELFEGTVSFGVPVTVARKAHGRSQAVVTVNYQLCSDRVCAPSQMVRIPLSFERQSGPVSRGR